MAKRKKYDPKKYSLDNLGKKEEEEEIVLLSYLQKNMYFSRSNHL